MVRIYERHRLRIDPGESSVHPDNYSSLWAGVLLQALTDWNHICFRTCGQRKTCWAYQPGNPCAKLRNELNRWINKPDGTFNIACEAIGANPDRVIRWFKGNDPGTVK